MPAVLVEYGHAAAPQLRQHRLLSSIRCMRKLQGKAMSAGGAKLCLDGSYFPSRHDPMRASMAIGLYAA